jgi:predicted RNA-binding Zn ribbon-like protein
MSREVSTDPRFRLTGGRLCLDLVATLGRRHGDPIERLPDDMTLVDWLVAVRLLPPHVAVSVLPNQLEAVRDLREVTYRLVRATMAGAEFDEVDVTRLNKVAMQPDLAPRLSLDRTRQLTWGEHDPVGAALATLARDAVGLLIEPQTSRIKECERPDCSLLFFDDSQAGRRRWCSMDRCGNLVKIAGYRQRSHR